MLCDRIDGIQNEAEGDHDERKEQCGDQNQGQTQQHVDQGFSTAHADYDTPQVRYTSAAPRQTNAVGRYAAALVTFAACGPF